MRKRTRVHEKMRAAWAKKGIRAVSRLAIAWPMTVRDMHEHLRTLVGEVSIEIRALTSFESCPFRGPRREVDMVILDLERWDRWEQLVRILARAEDAIFLSMSVAHTDKAS